MKRWLRQILLVIGVLLTAAVLLSVIGIAMFRATPSWYAPTKRPAAQRQQLAQSAENKLIETQNWAAELHADTVRADRAQQQGAAAPATRAAGSHVVDFSEEELNALFDKWSVMYGWAGSYAQFVESPTLALREDRLILAGKVRELGTVVSMQLHPWLDPAGQLRLELVKVTGGRLPLPDSAWTKYRNSAAAAVQRQLPRLRLQAKIGASGAANTAAMSAAMGQLLLQVAQKQPAEPVLFLPLAGQGEAVPVKVTEIEIVDGKMTLGVAALTERERVALLMRIRGGR